MSRLTAAAPPGGHRRTSNPGWPRGPPPVGASRRDLPTGCARRSPEWSPGDGGSIPPTSTNPHACPVRHAHRAPASKARPYVVAWRRLTEEDEDRFRTLSRLRRTPMSTWIFARSKKYLTRGASPSRMWPRTWGVADKRWWCSTCQTGRRTPRSRWDRLRRLLSRSAITSRRVGRVTWRTTSSPSKRRVSPDIPCRSWCDPLSGAAEAVVVGVPVSSSVGGQGSAVDGARGSVRLDAPRVG